MRRPSAPSLSALAVAIGCAALVTGCAGDPGTAVELTASSPAGAADDARASLSTVVPAPAPGSGGPDAATALPSEASVGGVVDGFPADLLPVYPGAEVLLTSALAAPGRLELTLAGQTPDAPQAVVAFYRDALTAAGFAESPSGGGEGVLGATFTRSGGTEVLSVAVAASPEELGRQQFTVGGTITAAQPAPPTPAVPPAPAAPAPAAPTPAAPTPAAPAPAAPTPAGAR